MRLRAAVIVLSLALAASSLGAAASQLTYFAAQQAQSLDNAGGGARALALGSAFVAVADDSSALAWNPAGLAGLNADLAGLHHNAWLAGISQDSLAVALKPRGFGGFGISVDQLDFGSFEQRDSTGALTGTFQGSRLGLDLGWGGQASGALDVGAAVRGSRETLADSASVGVGASLGFLYHPADGLRIGGCYQDAGNASGDSLASGFFLGAAQQFQSGALQGLLAGGLELEPAGVNRLQLGVEAGYKGVGALRAGYLVNFQPDAWQGLNSLTLGGGATLGPLKLDYAWLPYGDLGSSQRLSLEYVFGDTAPARPVTAVAPPHPVPAPSPVPTAVPTPLAAPAPVAVETPAPQASAAYRVLSEGYLLGQQLEQSGQSSSAASAYRVALNADASDAGSWEALAHLYERLGATESARACYQGLLNAEPGNAEAPAWLKAHAGGQ